MPVKPVSDNPDAECSEDTPRLQDFPNWIYLLKEFHEVYSLGSAGGSKVVRAHRKKVRDQLSVVINGNPRVQPRQAATKPVTAHLPRAFDLGARGTMSGMSRALERAVDDLSWEYGYARVPVHLAKKYAYCEVLGPQGPVMCDSLTLGFVLFAPRTTYPQHSHSDIEESYISVAGAWSENETVVLAPGSLILNTPGHEHRITTGNQDPCLLAYAWIGPSNRLTDPGMKFSKARKSG
ncbi:MAG: dimethylsulfonioproprionate lyase family protein [Pseudomonadota bacterium]